MSVWRPFVWFVLMGMVTVVLPTMGFAGFEQKGKAKKVDSGDQKAGGPRAPVKSSPGPVTGRSYDDIVAQSGPARRRAWSPRPLLATAGRQVVAVVRGRVHTSGDGGSTWAAGESIAPSGEEAVAIGSVESGTWLCILRSGAAVESRDGGASWSTVAQLAQLSEITGPRAVEVAGVGPVGAWAIVRGYSEPLPSSALLVRDASGWKLSALIPGAVVAAWRSDVLFTAIVGSTVILGGTNGESQARGATLSGASLNNIAFASATKAWIAADSGLVVESNDGGKTWLPRPVLAGQDLDVIGSDEPGMTWVVGHAGARGNLAFNRQGRPEWKISLQAPAPLSRPARANAAELLVLDGAGVVWTAKDLAGPWSRRGSLAHTR